MQGMRTQGMVGRLFAVGRQNIAYLMSVAQGASKSNENVGNPACFVDYLLQMLSRYKGEGLL